MFRRLDTVEKKSVQVVEQLMALLRKGMLREGDRLPIERDMMEQLGLSRTALREALSALQLAGYLGSRPGYGHYVMRVPSGTDASVLAADRLAAGLSIVEVIEARAALDLSVACLAVKHASEEDIAKADAVLREMQSALEDGEYARYASLSLDFHQVLAASTGNTYLVRAVGSFIDVVRRSVWVIARNYDPSKGAYSLEIHRQMLNGVRQRSIEAVLDAVWAHYHDYPSLRDSEQHRRDTSSTSRPDDAEPL